MAVIYEGKNLDYDDLSDRLREEGINEVLIAEMTFGGDRSGEWLAVRGSEKFCFRIVKRIVSDKHASFDLTIEQYDDEE